MKAKIRIRLLSISAEVESEDPQLAAASKKLIESSEERLEAAMAQALAEELKRMLPGITAEVTGAWNEGGEEEFGRDWLGDD